MCSSARNGERDRGTLASRRPWSSARRFGWHDAGETDIPGNDKQPARSAMWLGTIPLGLLAVAGLFAIPRWLPASSVSLPDIGHAQQQPPASSIATKPRGWPRCPECGEIESVRRVVRSDGSSGRTRGEVDAGAAGVASKSAIVATDDGLNAYEVTVRHRDGSTTTFGTTSPHFWRVGSRVNVIGTPEASMP